jgi:hypothetical protein
MKISKRKSLKLRKSRSSQILLMMERHQPLKINRMVKVMLQLKVKMLRRKRSLLKMKIRSIVELLWKKMLRLKRKFKWKT